MCFWGYSFEAQTTGPMPVASFTTVPGEASQISSTKEAKGPVDNRPCFCSVVRVRLNEHRILMAGEVG